MADDEDVYFSVCGDGLWGLYLQKNGCCFNIRRVGNRVHLKPCLLLAGILSCCFYLCIGSSAHCGNGLLLGPRSLFRNIPILK